LDVGITVLVVLFVCSITSILSTKFKIAYSKLLVVSGALLSFAYLALQIPPRELTGELILSAVLPPLIFQAALTIDYKMFRKVQKIVLVLAIVSVAVSAIVSSFILVIVGVPFMMALAFGVIISPTDAAAVIDTLKQLRAPKQLETILNGEALLNDATALALFSGVIAMTLNPVHYGVGILTKFVGGAIVGLVLGYGANKLMPVLRRDVQVMITISMSYGSFILANAFGFSGIVAVAVLGLYVGRYFQKTKPGKARNELMLGFWNVAAFLAESVAFISIGLTLNPLEIVRYAPLVVIAFAAVLAARYVSVEALLVPLSRLVGPVPRSWRNVISLAGIRGAVSAALALSLPDFPFKSEVVAVTFGVILLSLLVQTKLLSHYARRAIL
jgi:Na+:H+ antiporter